MADLVVVSNPNSQQIEKPFTAAMADAHIDTVGHGGKKGKALMVENTFSGNRMNKDIQFVITNADAGGTNKLLRIGSHVGIEGNAVKLNVAAGCEGGANVSDQLGAKVLKVQGFSLITTTKPIVIDQIRVQSSDATQLSAALNYNAINPDTTVDARQVNLLATQTKQDFRTDLNIADGNWILDSTNYLEILSYGGKNMQIVVRIVGYANVTAFVPVS